jgi:hypothetical protein
MDKEDSKLPDHAEERGKEGKPGKPHHDGKAKGEGKGRRQAHHRVFMFHKKKKERE